MIRFLFAQGGGKRDISFLSKLKQFGKKPREEPKNIVLDLNSLPWVSQLKNLGCTIQSNNSMGLDLSLSRCSFNAKVNSILQEFHSCNHEVLMKWIKTYATSFTSALLWDFSSGEFNRLLKSWNVTIREVFRLDRRTHRCLIESLSNTRHLKTMILSRFVTFAQKLLKSKKFTVRFL